MNVIDNFNQINNLLDFSNKATFYFVQIIKRKKENPELGSNNKTVNVYFLYKKEDLLKLKPFIVQDCESHNARAYINLNKLNLERVGLKVLTYISECLEKGDYKSIKNAYTTVCGRSKNDSMKKWVVDLDVSNELEYGEFICKVESIKFFIEKLQNKIKDKKYGIVAEIPTKNGIHLITNPFNLQEFKKVFPKIEVHKNNPTILYQN